jgi:polyisoprenoid-binding protein YceI
MRNIRLGAALLACSLYAGGASFVLKPSDTARIELTVDKTGLLRGKQHLFVFEEWSGMLQFTPGKPEQAVVTLSIKASSIRCLDTWVSAKDLRNIEETARKDMLAADRFPQITFVSDLVRRTEGADHQIRGMVTMRGLAKPATVLVTMKTDGSESLRFDGSATVRLSDYGLKPPSAILGAIGTRNEIMLRFTLVATPVRD